MRGFTKTLLILLFAVAGLYANSLNIDPNQSGSIVCSPATQSPTQILNNDSAATRTFIVNTSTNNVFLVGYSTTSAISISSAAVVSTNLTNGSFFILGNSTITFSPDGPNQPYTGPMWCTGGGTGAVVQRFRTH